MNDRLRGRSGRLNRVPFLHGHRRFRDTDSGLRLRCKHACSKQEQRCRKCARPDRKPAETQNRADTLFRAASGKAAAKGRRPDLPLCHVKKRQCVGFFADRAKRAQNGLIAGQFHIAVRKAHHKPNQRVPPVQAQTGSQQQLTQTVFAADMRQIRAPGQAETVPDRPADRPAAAPSDGKYRTSAARGGSRSCRFSGRV